MKALNICKIIGHCRAFVLHISLRKFQIPSTFRLGEITVGVTNSLTTLKMGWVGKRVCLLSNCRYGQKKCLKVEAIRPLYLFIQIK